MTRRLPPHGTAWIRETGLPVVIVAVAACLAYHNTFNVPFLHDDVVAIVENPTIRQFSWATIANPPGGGSPTQGRPLINLSFALNFALGRLHVQSYHILNLTIHIATAIILFALIRRTLLVSAVRHPHLQEAGLVASMAALTWALHPLQTESITYVSQRAESLAALFYVIVLYALLRHSMRAHTRSGTPPGSHSWASVAVGACALGMLTKETVGTAPLCAMLFDRAFLSPSWREVWCRRGRLHTILLSLSALVPLLIVAQGRLRHEAQEIGSQAHTWHYLITQPGVVLHYLRLLVWPNSLCFDYNDWPLVSRLVDAWAAIAIVTTVVAASAIFSLRGHPVAFLVFAFFLILAPSSSLVAMIEDNAAEHRLYLAIAPLCALFTCLFFRALDPVLCTRRPTPIRGPTAARARLLLAATILIVLGVSTYRRNAIYTSEWTLWRDVHAKRPKNTRATNNLGALLLQQGDLDASVAMSTLAIATSPKWAFMAHNNRGWARTQLGEFSAALDDFDQSIALKPGYADAWNNRGSTHLRMGNTNAAIRDLTEALRLRPSFEQALLNRTEAWQQSGQTEAALRDVSTAIALNGPLASHALRLRAHLLENLGQMDAAANDYATAIRLDPADPSSVFSLATLQLRRGQPDVALTGYTQVLKLNPSSAEAYHNRAACYLAIDQPLAALLDLERAQSLGLAPHPELLQKAQELTRQLTGTPPVESPTTPP